MLGATGSNFSGKFQCPDCKLKYDTEKALNVHRKWIHQHDGGSLMNTGYTLVYEFDASQLNALACPPCDLPRATQQHSPRDHPRGARQRDPREPFFADQSTPSARSKL